MRRFYPVLYEACLGTKAKERLEKVIMRVAISLFLIHLLFILFYDFGWISVYGASYYLNVNPLVALYTPFSVIVFYEIYLLIYYLPESISHYIGKQYEIVCLITIRRIFDQLASVGDVTLENEALKLALYKMIGVILIFFLIFLFYKLTMKIPSTVARVGLYQRRRLVRFIRIKKLLSIILLFIFVSIFVMSLYQSVIHPDFGIDSLFYSIKSINKSFYSTFFSSLILAEVLLLLFTIDLSDRFSKVIRNSAFIISTVLLKLSFATGGIMSIIIITIAIAFSVIVLWGYVLYRKHIS